MNKSKNKITLKVMFSYLVLACLALVAGYFILSEVRVFLSTETSQENDAKLLKTGSLLTELYEAESLSKLALQTRTKKNFNAYAQKIDSVLIKIDTLKLLTESDYQKRLLDSVQILLQEKVSNGNELRNLKVKNASNNSFDNALEELDEMEASFGKLTVKNFNENPEKLEPYKRKILEDWVAYLNQNIPENTSEVSSSKKIDSILATSKSILDKAKKNDTRAQRSLAQKEMQLNRNDLELSQQLRSMVSAFEREIMVNTYNDNLKRKSAFRRSIRLAGFAAVMGFVIVAIFTFLITRDFWRIQTYRQKLEKEKKYSESILKSREQLISTVSHDLRTPLNTITGYSELMENTGLSGKQVRYLKNVKSASHYVDSLVNDLLDFSKLEAGKIKIESIPFILSDLITETSENLGEIHNKKTIDLILDIDEKFNGAVIGDPFRIRQILTNLIGNAYKFTQEGFIKVKAFVEEESNDIYTTVIQVSDSGIGIKKEKQKLIFKEFTQADDSTEKKYGGYGLGLTISKKLIDLLNGTISLKSEEQKGSTFTLTLPLEISKIPVKVPKQTFTTVKTELSILILDDDSAMLRLLKEVCESLEVNAHIFNDFIEIKENMNIFYDVVLTDIQMPNIDGFEVLKKLQSEKYSHYRGQPIIAMTGRKDLEKKAYTDVGFAKILQKPFTKSSLLSVLEELFPRLGIQSIAPESTTDPKTISNLFSLDLISSFLGENTEAVDEVLQTFIEDTAKNIKLLRAAVDRGDYVKINKTAHRMLPMFRQIKAHELIPILERMELLLPNSTHPKKLKRDFLDLQHKNTALLLALKHYLTTSPSYNG
ncbi:MAG: ATP-binding protein [Bacteroidota bacterium]